MGEIDDIVLDAGDILYDTLTGDIAILVRRTTSHMRRRTSYPQINDDVDLTIYVWKMYWVPVDWCTYTEPSLLNMVDTGRFVQYKGKPKK